MRLCGTTIRAKVLIHERVVPAILALLEERQNDQTHTHSEDTNRPQHGVTANVRGPLLARLALDATLLRVHVVMLRHYFSQAVGKLDT